MELANKKGFFFTVLILVFISLILFSSIFYTEVQERKAIEKRIETMNSFLLSTEKDLERNVYVSGFRIIFLIEKRITETGSFISNVNSTFSEAFFNGTLNGEAELLDTGENIMDGATFSDISSALQTSASKINVNISLLSPNISVLHEDPWHATVKLALEFYMKDSGGLAVWNKTLITKTSIPLAAFEDPLYLVSTYGKFVPKIVMTNYTVFAQGSDVSNLTAHLNNYTYKASTSAPSFLDRLEGNVNSASPNGIESLVYLPALSSQGISVESKSVIDYIYFSSSNPASYQITGMPSWFRLENQSNHLALYNVSGLAY